MDNKLTLVVVTALFLGLLFVPVMSFIYWAILHFARNVKSGHKHDIVVIAAAVLSIATVSGAFYFAAKLAGIIPLKGYMQVFGLSMAIGVVLQKLIAYLWKKRRL